MEKTRKRLSEYWDNLFLRFIPKYGDFNKVEQEVLEHFSFLGLMFKRIIIPLLLIYIIVAIILDMNLFGSIFISLIIFFYSNFIPDVDFLVKKTEHKESLWYDKYFLLFFAPIVLFYIFKGEAKPILSKKDRCFHNLYSALIWALFLFIVGNIFWNEGIKILIFTSLGFLGYCFHLGVDGIISLEKFIIRKKKEKKEH